MSHQIGIIHPVQSHQQNFRTNMSNSAVFLNPTQYNNSNSRTFRETIEKMKQSSETRLELMGINPSEPSTNSNSSGFNILHKSAFDVSEKNFDKPYTQSRVNYQSANYNNNFSYIPTSYSSSNAHQLPNESKNVNQFRPGARQVLRSSATLPMNRRSNSTSSQYYPAESTATIIHQNRPTENYDSSGNFDKRHNTVSSVRHYSSSAAYDDFGYDNLEKYAAPGEVVVQPKSVSLNQSALPIRVQQVPTILKNGTGGSIEQSKSSQISIAPRSDYSYQNKSTNNVNSEMQTSFSNKLPPIYGPHHMTEYNPDTQQLEELELPSVKQIISQVEAITAKGFDEDVSQNKTRRFTPSSSTSSGFGTSFVSGDSNIVTKQTATRSHSSRSNYAADPWANINYNFNSNSHANINTSNNINNTTIPKNWKNIQPLERKTSDPTTRKSTQLPLDYQKLREAFVEQRNEIVRLKRELAEKNSKIEKLEKDLSVGKGKNSWL